MASTLERWNGSAWVAETKLIRFTLVDSLYLPMFLEVSISNGHGVAQANYAEFQRVRLKENQTNRFIFYGRVYNIEPIWDSIYGQTLLLVAQDNLQELFNRTIDTSHLGFTRRSELIKDIVDSYIFDPDNLGHADTQKFETSEILQAASDLNLNYAASGWSALRAIYEIAREDPIDTDFTRYGYVFYADQDFTITINDAQLHYFKRGDRPSGGPSTHGLTVEYTGSDGDLTRAMMPEYNFPRRGQELVTLATVQYKDNLGRDQFLKGMIINHGSVTNGPFSAGSIVTWGGGSARIEQVGSTYLVVGPDNIRNTDYLNNVSGQTLTSGSTTAEANASTDDPPGSLREALGLDKEIVIRDYSIQFLSEARSRLSETLHHGGNTVQKGNFKIFRWPYYAVTGSHTGSAGSSVLQDSGGQFLDHGVRIGDVVENVTDGSSARITAVTATQVDGNLGGGAQNDWDNGDEYIIYVIVRAGHSIRVINSNASVDQDMMVSRIEYDEGPGVMFSLIDVIDLDRGSGIFTADYLSRKNELETAVWRPPISTLVPFGDGSDGDVTITGNTSLTRDMFYENLTVNVSVVLTTAGYRIFVRDTLTLNGTIRSNGADGSPAGIGPGAGGAGATSGSLSGGLNGGAGGDDGSGGDDAENGTRFGGVGGDGGGGGGEFNEGADPSVAIPTSAGSLRVPIIGLSGFLIDASTASLVAVHGGGGGGGGGSGGVTRGNGEGGGGGGGGGIILLFARTLEGEGTIEANGGSGGDGEEGEDPGDDGGGGGGAGGGGAVFLISSSTANPYTLSVATGGVGSGGSSGGGGGSNGSGGSLGSPGETLLILGA